MIYFKCRFDVVASFVFVAEQSVVVEVYILFVLDRYSHHHLEP